MNICAQSCQMASGIIERENNYINDPPAIFRDKGE